MAADTCDKVLDELGKMTVLELVELKKKIEEEWGITAAAPVAVAAAGAPPAGGDGAAGRRGEDSVRRRPHGRRRQEDPGDQGRPRGHRPRPQGGEGPRRRRPRRRQGGRRRRTRPTRSRRSSKRPAPPSSSSSGQRLGRSTRSRRSGHRQAASGSAPFAAPSLRPGRSAPDALAASGCGGACVSAILRGSRRRLARLRPPHHRPSRKGGCPFEQHRCRAARAQVFLAPEARPRPPQPDRHPEGLVRVVPGRGPPRDDRRHLADRGLHRHARRRVRRLRVRRAAALDQGVPREGPDLPGPALDDRPLRQHGDGRDPRAAGLHGRLPDDDRARARSSSTAPSA